MSRSERYAKIIREEIAQILQTKINDRRLRAVTITLVEVTGDLSVARVHYSVWDEKNFNRAKAKQAIEAATGFIRRELGQRVEARIVPELRFIYDDSIQRGVDLAKKIQSLNQNHEPSATA